MFGYVRPLKGELRVREYEQYRAAYCGLCHALGRRCGFAARFLVNYDLTFFYLLLRREAPCCAARRCPAHPLRKRSCAGLDDPAMELAADASVLLFRQRLLDTARDESGLRRLGARMAARILRRPYLRAAARRPEFEALTRAELDRLHMLEAAGCESLDRTADAFASILRGLASYFPEAERRPAAELLYHVGRYLYLADALDDLGSDLKKGRYNPVAARYGTTGALAPDDRAALLDTIRLSVGRAAAAMELLERGANSGVTENILYLGLPAVLDAVADGTFQKSKK